MLWVKMDGFNLKRGRGGLPKFARVRFQASITFVSDCRLGSAKRPVGVVSTLGVWDKRSPAPMHNGIGLRTPRGSGTSGYVEANKAFVKSNPPVPSKPAPSGAKISKSLQDYDSKRKIALECYKLQKQLEASQTPPEEIEKAVAKLRETLTKPADTVLPIEAQGGRSSAEPATSQAAQTV
jgi:hypothetical protein